MHIIDARERRTVRISQRPPQCSVMRSRSMDDRSAEALRKEIQRGGGEGAHVGDAVGVAGLHGDRPLARPHERQAGMAGGIAVAIAGGAGGAGLAERPGRAEPLARCPREQQRIGLGRGPHARQRRVRYAQKLAPRLPRVDDGAAEEIGRGAGHGQQCRRDQSPGRGFRDGERLAARLETGADRLGKGQKRLHRVSIVSR